ncbi:MAG TPA: sigma-70 family RNA polymerase sigma factor [Amycolatopsis sp.]|nr:sigma-70 family RNA polymerase sigma factor [Amycolatopsis sp.]
MRDDPTVVMLVKRARDGDKTAWDEIVERYSPLVFSLCARYRLTGADADDVGAGVWLRLVERLDTLREPAALPGWLSTTTRNECLRVLRAKLRQIPTEADLPSDDPAPAADEWLVAEERLLALRRGFATLTDQCRRLLGLLFADPPVTYTQISDRLGLAVGGIGPTRMRCLAALRKSPPVAAMMAGDPETGG